MAAIRSLLIAQRGEIAVRIIRACRELGVRPVAVYSDADAGALHVRLADDAVAIGRAPASESYLRGEKLIAAAQTAGCAAIHPGYGFLSENANFARQVREAGLIFVGPSAAAIESMGDKVRAREIMKAAGVPVLPAWKAGDDAIEFPLLVKAIAGGGGKGMRLVTQPDDLAESIAAAQREAKSAFGDDRVYVEKYIANARHIEVQIFGNQDGDVLHLFERECSIQRRHQKIVEESPSPLLDEKMRTEMTAAAVAAASAVDYVGAGTVEFIVDAESREFYFLEMNTRLQVEHPVTELVTGIDLVRAQLQVAAGERLELQQADIRQRGHAIECRIYAEDAQNGFMPDAGTVLLLHEPHGPGVRVDSGIESGAAVPVHYDPLLAKLCAHAEERAGAIRRMDAALREYTVLGVRTSVGFLRDVINHPAFLAGDTTTDFIDQNFAAWQPPAAPEENALRVAAILDEQRPAGIHTAARARKRFSAWDRADGFRIGS